MLCSCFWWEHPLPDISCVTQDEGETKNKRDREREVSTGRCWQHGVRDKDFLPSRWFGSVGNCIPGSQRARWQLILAVSHVSRGTRSLCRGNCGQREGLPAPARKPSGILFSIRAMLNTNYNTLHPLVVRVHSMCVYLYNTTGLQISCNGTHFWFVSINFQIKRDFFA